MSDSHHVHGDLGNDDGLPDNHRSDPRIAADAAEIAHWNKVEAENGRLDPLVISQNTYFGLEKQDHPSSLQGKSL